MTKNLLYGALIVIVIIGFTIFWKNSQKDEINGEEVVTPPIVNDIATENQTPVDTSTNINNDVNNIQVDSGIDNDLKEVDTDIGTL